MSDQNPNGSKISVGFGNWLLRLRDREAIVGFIAIVTVCVIAYLFTTVELTDSQNLAEHRARQEVHIGYDKAVHEELKGYAGAALTAAGYNHEAILRELKKLNYLLSLSEEEKHRFQLRMPEELKEDLMPSHRRSQ